MQPGLSVIVHGPNEQGHLGELLDSLGAQPFAAAEVIVAAVGDWARQEAERHAARDPRIVPLAVAGLQPLDEGQVVLGGRA
ncbi:hypothetical protein, partial [Streptomyces avermitilis]|uniref:hypothetical protein n=1 Tax=Streptomyces avermitilis TaxID=33903 RepID=UPI003F4BE9AE